MISAGGPDPLEIVSHASIPPDRIAPEVVAYKSLAYNCAGKAS